MTFVLLALAGWTLLSLVALAAWAALLRGARTGCAQSVSPALPRVHDGAFPLQLGALTGEPADPDLEALVPAQASARSSAQLPADVPAQRTAHGAPAGTAPSVR